MGNEAKEDPSKDLDSYWDRNRSQSLKPYKIYADGGGDDDDDE